MSSAFWLGAGLADGKADSGGSLRVARAAVLKGGKVTPPRRRDLPSFEHCCSRNAERAARIGLPVSKAGPEPERGAHPARRQLARRTGGARCNRGLAEAAWQQRRPAPASR